MTQTAGNIATFLAKQEILLFVLLGVLILAAILLVAWIIHRAAKRAEEEAEIAKGEAPMAAPEEAGEEKHGHGHGHGAHGGREKSFAGWWQFRRAFRLGLSEYRRFVAQSRNYYLVPWYLFLGESGAGKSQILTSVGPNRPPVYLPDAETGRPVGCTWWFYDEATVIEAAGEALQGGTVGASAQRGWSMLLSMLHRYRPQRPIDGVILALPITDLVGPNRLDTHQLRQKARELYARLFQAQGRLGLCMPIYIVLTKCDRISGFDTFTRALPETLRDDIFGWSNPYPLEMPFAGPWLDEAFRMMAGELVKLHIELYAGGRGHGEGDDIFTFSSGLREIQAPLGELLTTVFRRTAYHETFYFRGIYLTGDLNGPAETPHAPAHAAAAPAAAHGHGGHGHGGHGHAAHGHAAPAHAAAAPHHEPVLSQHPAQQVFADRLFIRKIFAERDLAKPTPASAMGFQRRKLIQRGILGAIAALLLLFLWSDYQHADVWALTMQPVLQDLPDEFRVANDGVAALQGDGSTGTPSLAVKQNVAAYLDDIAGLSDPFSSILMPGAGLDGSQDQARAALAAGYFRVVLVPLRASLDRRIQAIVGGKTAPEDGSEVDAFVHYVADIRTAEAAAGVYNRLNGNPSLFGLPTLLRYTYGINLTPDFVDHAVAYDIARMPDAGLAPGAVRASELAPVNLSGYRAAANDRLEQLAEAAYARLADGSLVAARLRLVANDLATATAPGQGPDAVIAALQSVLAGLRDASAQITSDTDFWTGRDSLVFSPQLATALDQVAQSSFFGPDVRDRLVAEARARFAAVQPDIRMVDSVIGPLVTRDARGMAQLSPTALALMSGLDGLFQQDFMQPKLERATLGTVNQAVVWDATTLAPVPAMIDHYLVFSGKGFESVPDILQPTVKAVALVQLRTNLFDAVAGARRPLDVFGTDSGGGDGQDSLRQQINALSAAAPVLIDILHTFRQLGLTAAYGDLHALVQGQARGLLTSVDEMSRSNQFFTPLPAVLESWEGAPLTNFQLFGLTDPASLGQYLDTSRQYLAAIARGMAAPLVDVLNRLDPDTGTTAMTQRWAETLADLDKYDSHAPGSSVAALTSFVTVDLASIDLTQCGKLSGGVTPLFSVDVFAARLNALQSQILGRCQAIIGRQAFVAYDAIVQAFNRDLAGLFPFAEPGGPETTPDAVADFYQVFDQNAGTVSAAIQKAPQYFVTGGRVLGFLGAMQQARDLLVPSSPTDDVPSVTLDIHARTNRDAEIGGNQIIEWRLAAGPVAYDSLTNTVPLVWHYGDPVTLTLRWAKDSDFVPVIIGRRVGRAAVDDRSLTLSFDGNWSLIAMLRALGAEPGVLGRGLGNRSTLQIDFDTKPAKGGGTAHGRVFLSLAMKQGGGPSVGAAGPRWIAVPAFPTAAPDLGALGSQAAFLPNAPLDLSALSASLNSINAKVPPTSPTPLVPSAVDQLNQ
jgi:type VI secretion system protein ImpL